jgi:hypothetical protein
VREARGNLASLAEQVLAKKFTIMQASKQGNGDQAQYWSLKYDELNEKYLKLCQTRASPPPTVVEKPSIAVVKGLSKHETEASLNKVILRTQKKGKSRSPDSLLMDSSVAHHQELKT